MSKRVIEAEKLFVKIGQKIILKDLNFTICQDQGWAIVGPSGSGKSTLGLVMKHHRHVSSGKLNCYLPADAHVAMVAQQHAYKNLSDASVTYYQARFDSCSAEDSPVVEDVLQQVLSRCQNQENYFLQAEQVLKLLKIEYLRKTRLIQLSSGENKRFQMAKALLQNPRMLILDNPFIGLDREARRILHEVVNHLIWKGMVVILITTPAEIPDQITHVLELKTGSIAAIYSRTSFLSQHRQKEINSLLPPVDTEVLKTIGVTSDNDFRVAVGMQQVSVQYAGRKILDAVNWQVNKGDKWALIGPNGAGKSTLLSLINGDNPQAYANAIYLFDRKRGSGESIWDIKRKIGFISPELHLYFNRRLSCFEAVASGLMDKMFCPKKMSEAQKAIVYQWLALFQLLSYEQQPLADMPLSVQRQVLLARALVKNPPVLILDEPCQGLDLEQTRRFTDLVDMICRHFEKTLIYVSHYPEDIPSCVEQFLFLEEGRVKALELKP